MSEMAKRYTLNGTNQNRWKQHEEPSKISRESLMEAVRILKSYCIDEKCDSCLMADLCGKIAPNHRNSWNLED